MQKIQQYLQKKTVDNVTLAFYNDVMIKLIKHGTKNDFSKTSLLTIEVPKNVKYDNDTFISVISQHPLLTLIVKSGSLNYSKFDNEIVWIPYGKQLNGSINELFDNLHDNIRNQKSGYSEEKDVIVGGKVKRHHSRVSRKSHMLRKKKQNQKMTRVSRKKRQTQKRNRVNRKKTQSRKLSRKTYIKR